MAQVIVGRPFRKFELPDEHRLQPQCRMPDYVACIWGNDIGGGLTAICTSVALILIGIVRPLRGFAETKATDRPA